MRTQEDNIFFSQGNQVPKMPSSHRAKSGYQNFHGSSLRWAICDRSILKPNLQIRINKLFQKVLISYKACLHRTGIQGVLLSSAWQLWAVPDTNHQALRYLHVGHTARKYPLARIPYSK